MVVALLSTWGVARAEVTIDGISGILVTPTAEVVNEGEAVINLGRHLSTTIEDDATWHTRTYTATVGYLPNLELTLRFADFPDRPDPNQTTNFQDRSFSAKYQLWANNDWSFALGATDVGGQSQQNEAYYGVLTCEAAEGLQLSAGAGTDLLEGGFGSIRWSPSRYISFVGEYANEQINYGLELRPLEGLTLKGGIVNEHAAYTASYHFALDPRGQETLCCPVVLQRCEREFEDPCTQAAIVRDALMAQSFENVVVGSDGETLFVEFENRRFREQLDGIGVAAAIAAAKCDPNISEIVLTPKIDDVPQLSLHVGVDELLAFLSDPCNPGDGICVTSYYPGGYPVDTRFASEGAKKPGRGEVALRLINGVEITRPSQPSWRARAGLGVTETVFVGRGLRLDARQDWPFFNDISEKTDPVNRDAFLRYFDSPARDLFVLAHAGYFGGERFGGIGEAGYYFTPGRFSLGGVYAYVEDRSSGENDPEDGLTLGKLTYFDPRLDLELTALGGRFTEGDDGWRVESTRYFGPTELTFFAYDTDSTDPEGGIRFFIPLPWYSQKRHDSWRAVGAPYLGYQYRTDGDPWGSMLLPARDISHARERLRPEYVAAHLDQLRRAVYLYLGE